MQTTPTFETRGQEAHAGENVIPAASRRNRRIARRRRR